MSRPGGGMPEGFEGGCAVAGPAERSGRHSSARRGMTSRMDALPVMSQPAEPRVTMNKPSKATNRGLGTRAIHAGQHPDPSTGAIMTPIYATSTYVQESPGKHKGYEYSRTQNPTRMAYERCVADLEGGLAGFAFASGLAAAATVLDLLDSGSHVIAMDDLYGGTYRLFEKVRRRSAGLDFTFIDLND